MSMASYHVVRPLAVALGLALSTACASLTEPPAPEPIASDTAQVTPPASALAKPVQSAAPPAASANAQPPEKPMSSTDLKVGAGVTAKTGDKVSVHYVGTLENGTEFDSSRKRNQPFVFTLGQGQVIKGWDQGVVGMKVGGKRKLVIPPSLAYGERGRPSIPPNSTLVFEVELLAVNPK
jgi:peptidylprolyl isomerase